MSHVRCLAGGRTPIGEHRLAVLGFRAVASDTGLIHFRLIGPGRAGSSLLAALESGPWRCREVLGRGDDLSHAAAEVHAVILAVPDDAIASVAAAIVPTEAVLIHLSGAKTLDVLAPHDRRASVHPLVSLPRADVGARRLRDNCTFAVAGDGLGAELAEALGGRPIAVPEDKRAAYHAAASIASNHLVVLCAQIERIAAGAGVPADRYWDLMTTTLENVRTSGSTAALTGPAARGDHHTIASHLAALRPEEHELYLAVCREAAKLAGQPPYPHSDRGGEDRRPQ